MEPMVAQPLASTADTREEAKQRLELEVLRSQLELNKRTEYNQKLMSAVQIAQVSIS
jgi:hypothetical protein